MVAQRFTFGSFVLDSARGTLTRDGLAVAVGNRGLALLKALLEADNQVVSKTALMDSAWPGLVVEESNLSVQVAALRKILGPSPGGGEWILTVPRVGYRFVASAAVDSGSIAAPQTGHLEFSGKPSIAVMPFANLSGDRAQEYLADGISEDIITALARFRWFLVIARNSSFIYKGAALSAEEISRQLGVRYLLQGSIRKSGPRYRISAQLIDAAGGSNIWAERYQLEETEVFAIQDEIAERVAGAIEPELLKSEGALAAMRHTGNVTAWDLVRQGSWRFHKITRATHFEARDLFRQACRIDPQLPESHFWCARVNAGLLAYGWSEDAVADRREGFQAAITAIHLDERNPYCHYGLAIISVYGGSLEQAARAADKAIELSPSFALGHLVFGMVQLFSGRAAEAIPPLTRGLQLSPYDPQNFVWFNLLALACLFDGKPEAALQAALRALKVRPDWQPALETLVCCYVTLDLVEQAYQVVCQISESVGSLGDALAPLRQRNPQWDARIAEMLKRARACR